MPEMRLMKYYLIVLIAFLSMAACTPYKKIVVFAPSQPGDTMTQNLDTAYRPVIHPNDILDIFVMSTSPEASKYFNYGDMGQGGNFSGFLVDKKGEIEMPIVGSVKVGGLNSSDARDTVKGKLATYLVDPSVKLSIRNFRVTVLGEVQRPGVYEVPNEKLTLPEVLARAGDFTIFSERYNVTIIRDSAGYKTYGEVNLNNRELFTSRYFNLHANDILYVKPNKKKRFQGENYYRTIPFYLTGVSFILTLVQLFNTK